MTPFYSVWSPCTDCHCPNHHVPSHSFPPERHSLDNSNFAHLMRSNEPPLPAEADTLNAMILSYQAELKDIDSEESNLITLSMEMRDKIALLDQKVELLREERIRISEAINQRQRLLSPIRRLPTEILSRIFLQTIEYPIKAARTDTTDMWWKFQRACSAPWLIALVSRHWREVALDFPQLWSYVNILITDKTFTEGTYGFAQRIGEHMLRSGRHKLSVCIANDPDNSTFEELPLPLATILCSIANRIRDLCLFLSSSIFVNLPPLRLSLPQLERLSVLCIDITILNHTNLRIFDFCPKLYYIRVMDIAAVSEVFDLPWVQITQFKSKHTHSKDTQPGPTFDEVLGFLAAAINLKECSIQCENRGDDLLHAPVTCPKLHTLTLSGIHHHWRYDSVALLLDKIILPSLTTLLVSGKVGHEDREPARTFSAIGDMISRSKCSLKVLHYDHGSLLPEHFIGFLRNTPTLEDFRLTGSALDADTVTEQNLMELTVKLDGAKPLVPNLHTLFLDGTIAFPMKAFAEMVESR
ncbi:uncharacterized protein EV420DRAFT_1581795 [Desarmillaria tabescens]|uniref:F-box domain-containing protein n=1 Tax=Armillaria tabescens TaxID=1929756 RepID=A0AA39JCT6_ARMTA|nr:uncharacterized protein EV420DRAFT_1581795 [Desarmillaria tabescens]KAK0440407.1 hypothetical protein EV420DRAFT_1581795 [Desarmillaria tabescens]